jgi:hypothetical protein
MGMEKRKYTRVVLKKEVLIIDKAIALGATEFLVKMMTSPVKLSQRVNMYLSKK